MPTLKIATNVAQDQVPPGFLEKASSTFQAAIGKPIQFICVHLSTGQDMMFAGTTAPCASVNVTSIGKLGVEENKVLSKTIFGLLNDLGIEHDRAYIEFYDAAPEVIGFRSTTFHEILSKKST